MTLTTTQSTQLDEVQDPWINRNISENKQIISHKLKEFAPSLKNIPTGEIEGIKQYPSFEETLLIFAGTHIMQWTRAFSRSLTTLNYIQFNSPIRQSGDSTYEFFRTDLDAKTNTYCEQSSKVLLDKLLDMGFAWIHIAKIIHVPVYIVRDLDFDKDNCENLPKEPHEKLAQLLALIEILEKSELLEKRFPNQSIPSWLETTLDGYYYSGIDVISKDQIELLVRYAYGEINKTELLDKCFPNWKDNFDSRIEIFTASDGEKAIRLRNDNLED